MDVKLNIHSIHTAERLSTEQLFSVCEYFELLDPSSFILSNLQDDEILHKQYTSQVLKHHRVKEATSKDQDLEAGCKPGSLSAKFCFDSENKFICLSTKLFSGSHNIILPEIIENQVKSIEINLLFNDHVKLLTQACAMNCIGAKNQPVLLSWYTLSTNQLLMAAELFEVKVTNSTLLQHRNSLANFLEPLCATSEIFQSKGYSASNFEKLFFAFQLSKIFHCKFAVLAENSNYTAIVSANILPTDLSDESLKFLDGYHADRIVHRNLRSSSFNKSIDNSSIKVVSVGSTETFTCTQLNSIISHFNLDIPVVGKKNLKDRTTQFLCSQIYQQQLINSPLDLNLYCFDGNSKFVCMFHELSPSEHEIVATKKQRELYDFKLISPNYDDLRKILLQGYLTQTNYVIELPWIALTRTQMLTISRDKCPNIKIQKVLASKNIPGFLSGILKQSSAYKRQFTVASKFDSCLTFGISIEEPLLFCDWSVVDSTDRRKEVSKYKELFRKKTVINKEPLPILHQKKDTELTTPSKSLNITNPVVGIIGNNTLLQSCVGEDRAVSENPIYDKPEDLYQNKVSMTNANDHTIKNYGKIDPISSVNGQINKAKMENNKDHDTKLKREIQGDFQSDSSVSESSESEDSSYKESVSDLDTSIEVNTTETICSDYENCQTIVIKNISDNSADSRYQTCTATPTSEPDDPLSHNQDIENNPELYKSLPGEKMDNVCTLSETTKQLWSQPLTEDSEISVNTPFSVKNSLPAGGVENIPLGMHPSNKFSSTPKRGDSTSNSSDPYLIVEQQHKLHEFASERASQTSVNAVHTSINHNFCEKCKDAVEFVDILECYICCLKTHYSCYNQKKNGKPVANSYYNVASKHLHNYKWFCNECNELPREEVIQRMLAQHSHLNADVKSNTSELHEFSNPFIVPESTPVSLHSIATNIRVSPVVDKSDVEVTSYQDNILNSVQAGVQTIQKSQKIIEGKLTSLEKQTEDWINNNGFGKIDKKVIKAVQKNTETLCETLKSLQCVKDMNEGICQNKNVLLEVKEQVNSTCCFINDSMINEHSTYNAASDGFQKQSGPDTYKHAKENLLYSSMAQGHTHPNSGPVLTRNQPVKTTVEPKKTIVISKDIDKTLAKGSYKIRSAFNQNFKNVKIKNCFVSKGGSVFIEFTSEEDALSTLKAWKKEFFTDHTVNNASTTCTLFATMQNSVLLKGISLDILDNELINVITSRFPDAQARRFVRRDGTRLHTFKVDFTDLAQKQAILKEGIKYDNMKISAEDFIPRQRIIQCYNCFRFGHVAKLCNQKHPTCQVCAGNHSQDECHQQASTCRNCQSNSHFATSKDCPSFLEAMNIIRHKNSHKENNHINDIFNDF